VIALKRRAFLRAGLLGATFLSSPGAMALAQSSSLSDVGDMMNVSDTVTIYSAREIVTLDPSRPSAQAVAVVNDRILACGTLEAVKSKIGDQPFQIHIHVNGDAGLDRVLNALEINLRRKPRYDHRTTIVHFAVSALEQVSRIRQLGAIVSANPYYVTALADKYSETGLGPERADQMARLGDVERAGISYSLHSDMPMAPGDPLFLMWCAVNRITSSGRVAGEDQRVSREGALRGVTLDAAYSHRLENERGSIEPGKLANFTILEENPLTIDETKIKDIGVWGTLMEGRKLRVGYASDRKASLDKIPTAIDRSELARAAIEHSIRSIHSHG
jgi:predicted amidohydrolase YtcJ